MKTGFIGTGKMGSGMVANLLRSGHEVVVYNRTPEKTHPLVELGAVAVSAIPYACENDTVITMLSDDIALENVSFGSEGIVKNLPKEAIHISMSTISISLAEKLAEEHAKAGQYFVSAPVFGRPDAAAAGELFIVTGGEKSKIDDCKALFDAMGQKTFYAGERPRDANLIKLSGNFLIASVIESLGEAIALIGKAGIDRSLYLDILTSTLFTAPVYQTYGKQIVENKFQPAGFAAPLGRKDIALAMAAADSLKVPMPLANLLHDRFVTLLAQDGEALDWSAIGRLPSKDSGQ